MCLPAALARWDWITLPDVKPLYAFLWLGLLALLSACGPSAAEVDSLVAQAEDRVAATIYAQLTEAALANPTQTPQPSATQAPTATPQATATGIQVTATLTQSGPATDGCNLMTFREDVTIQDSEVVAGNATFTKTWLVENSGSCNWTPAYQLLFSHGDRMDGARTSQIGTTILSGDAGNISILLRAPTAPGEYTGWWTLASPLGEGFGHLSVVIIVP